MIFLISFVIHKRFNLSVQFSDFYHHIHIVVQAQTAVNFRALSSPLKLLPIGGLSPSAHWQPWVAFYLRGSVCSGRFMYLESHNMRSSWRASVWLRFLILRFIHSAACVSTSFYFQTVFYCKAIGALCSSSVSRLLTEYDKWYINEVRYKVNNLNIHINIGIYFLILLFAFYLCFLYEN